MENENPIREIIKNAETVPINPNLEVNKNDKGKYVHNRTVHNLKRKLFSCLCNNRKFVMFVIDTKTFEIIKIGKIVLACKYSLSLKIKIIFSLCKVNKKPIIILTKINRETKIFRLNSNFLFLL